MATTSSRFFPNFPPTGSPPPSPPNGPDSNSQGSNNNSIPPVSLVLYIFSVTLILLLLVLAAFVSRTVRRRRRRNATVLAALTTGAYGPSAGLRGKLPASKPVLWESHIAPLHEEDAKGWADIVPVAGATMVPVDETPADDVRFGRLASWPARLRFSPNRSRRQPPIVTVADSSPTLPSTEPPPPLSPEPVHLTVLISMPTPFAHTKAGQENGGPPVVELGVAQVAYTTPNVTQ